MAVNLTNYILSVLQGFRKQNYDIIYPYEIHDPLNWQSDQQNRSFANFLGPVLEYYYYIIMMKKKLK